MAEGYLAVVRLTNNRQLTQDLKTFLRVGEKYLRRQFDFLEWTSTLHVYGYIDDKKQQRLQQELLEHTGTRTQKSAMFFMEVMRYVSFDDFVELLYKQQQSDFAEELHNDRYRAVLGHMGRSEVPHSHFILKYYSNMKKHLDNNVFHNPKHHLQELVIEFKTKITDSVDVDNRQFNAEKLVAIYVLLLPQYTGYTKRKRMLDEMLEFFRSLRTDQQADNDIDGDPTVDSTSAEIVHASKMAVTTAIAGDFEGARRLAHEADFLGSLYQASLARTLAYHDHQYIYRREYMKTGRTDCLGKVLSIGDRGLRMLQDEHDDVRNQWNRLFMLYKVLSLLGIRSDFSMSSGYPKPEKVEQAKQILQEIRGSFDGIEFRREMIYTLAMARAFETTDVKRALSYADYAMHLSEQCGELEFIPKEKKNVKWYRTKLKRQCSLGVFYNLLSWVFLYEHIGAGWLSSLFWIFVSILVALIASMVHYLEYGS